ncbi:MAG: hypothetical protein KGJ73_03890 [Rhodospirillales bacterium]|nr:hypothetical protein [Rhodospirillales bacterium]
MTPTHEEVEALALMAEKSAYIAGVHDLPKLQQEWASVYTTLRALDTERQQLRAQRNLADAAVDAAGEMIADLRAQLAGAKNEGIVAAANKARDVFRDCLNGAQIRSAIRALMTPEAK